MLDARSPFRMRALKGARLVAGDMSDEGLEAAVEQFVAGAESAFDEYDKGYADADATLRLVRSHLDDLEEELD